MSTTTEPLDDRTETLLGKFLLGQATPQELIELGSLREHSPRLREVLSLIDGTDPEFRRSSVGDEREMTATDLPDYLHPKTMARRLDRWFETGILASIPPLVVLVALLAIGMHMLHPDVPFERVAKGILFGAVFAFALRIWASLVRRRRLGPQLAAGGPAWSFVVTNLQAHERRYMGRTPRTVMTVGFVVAAAGFPLAWVLPRPWNAVSMFACCAALAVGAIIAKRRFLLRELREDVA